MHQHLCIFLILLNLFSSIHSSSIQNYNLKRINHLDNTYNLENSKDYAILAVASYCDRKCLLNWNCQITNNYLKNDKVLNVTHFMGTLTRASGFIAYDLTKDLIVISLRGSANIQNWISDFSFDLIEYGKCKGCKVHVGFMIDYHSIQKNLNQAVDKLITAYPKASILVTGHSMGAALSIIVGLQLKLRINRIIQIHNIGCPRVGNPAFSQFVHQKVDRLFRVIHNRDLIPHLPPLQFGYHHSAYEVFFDKGMENYTVCNQTGQDKECSNKYFPQYDGKDHDFYFWDLGKILKC